MAKFRLYYKYEDQPSFIIPWVLPLVEPWFELVPFDDSEETFVPGRDFALVTYASKQSSFWYTTLRDRGCGVIVDHLWDSDVALTTRIQGTEIEIYCPNWMWYLACIEFGAHGYESYRRNVAPKHSFLLLMNQSRWHRDALLQQLEPQLHTALYSYNARGIVIDGDKDPAVPIPWQRYMNPAWYDHTAFSVVAESFMRNSWHPATMRTEVSEKLFKPLAYYHPFLVAGSVDTLKYLRSQGFETFDTWFDESYDSIENDHIRLATVGEQAVLAADRWHHGRLRMDVETWRRTQHNHNHLFNRDIVLPRFQREIIDPIQEFCECFL